VSDRAPDFGAVEWRVDAGLADYAATVAAMEARAAAIRAGTASELVWLTEHPPVYTAGTSAKPADLIDPRFPVHATGRGGQYTYHGPGQRMVYVLLDLGARGRDVRCFVAGLEAWLVAALGDLGVGAFTAPGRVGVWVADGDREAKIAAIGVRVTRWVTLHGAAINVAPDLGHYSGIVACGLPDHPVTSLAARGRPAGFDAVDSALARHFPALLATLGGVGACATPPPREGA
jgi:lipoyl(octanoyl) transferase